MRLILTALAFGLFAIAGLMPTGTPAAAATPPADGKVIVSCGWSDAGDCPFSAQKGKDYLLRVHAAQDCDGHIQLVNPVGQVTMDIFVSDYSLCTENLTVWGGCRRGRHLGSTSTSMLRATPDRRRIRPARSNVTTIRCTDGALTPKWRCRSASAGGRPFTRV